MNLNRQVEKQHHDNAVMESFYHTLKVELISGQRYRTRNEAQTAVFDYIEIFYNRQRLHSSLDYQTPEGFERAAKIRCSLFLDKIIPWLASFV